MVRPKRSLSQNFLIDKNTRRKLVDALGAGAGDTVLEIGAGHGELSELLVDEVRRLVLVEKDDRLAPGLADRWADRPNVVVVHGDALEEDLGELAGGPVRLISNVPYAITSPLLFRFLEIEPPPVRIVVLVQEEVARRITASPGGKEYGALSVGVQARASASLAFRVARSVFRPVPRVDSAAVVLAPRQSEPAVDPSDLRRLVRAAFSRRRKQLGTILRTAPEFRLAEDDVRRVALACGIDPAQRPETLAPETFVALARALAGEPENPNAS